MAVNPMGIKAELKPGEAPGAAGWGRAHPGPAGGPQLTRPSSHESTEPPAPWSQQTLWAARWGWGCRQEPGEIGKDGVPVCASLVRPACLAGDREDS